MSTVFEAPARRDRGSIRLTQVGLLIAGAGALLVIFNLFGIAIVGLIMMVVGTLLAARFGIGRRWFTTLAIGAALGVVSRLVAESAETLGGWLAVIAVILVLIGVSLGYPTGEEEPAD